MLPFFKRKAQKVLGVDISLSAVKLLELSRTGDRYRVEAYGVEPIPEEAIVDNAIAEPELVGEVLAKLISRLKPSTKLAAAAVTSAEAITKVITMDSSMTEDEIETQLELEADQHITYPVDEVRMDFCVLGPAANSSDKVNVLFVASRTENVQMNVDCLEAAGLKPVAVDVEAYAIERSFKLIQPHIVGGTKHKTTVVFDIGAAVTTIHVIQDNRVVYSREQSFGGKNLTQEIQRRYGLSLNEAGLAKKTGELPDDYEAEVLGPFKEAVTQHLSRALQFFYSSPQAAELDHIVLAGGSSQIRGLPEFVAEQMGVSCSLANPFLDMSLSKQVSASAISNDASALMVACGLALRSFD